MAIDQISAQPFSEVSAGRDEVSRGEILLQERNDADGQPAENQQEEHTEDTGSDLDRKGLVLLLVQHASSSWSYRSAEFAFPLYFVHLFTNTLLPASIYGFVTTGCGVLFSNWISSLVDTFSHRKLKTIQGFIFFQKLLAIVSYALFLVLFSVPYLTANALNNGRGPDRLPSDPSPHSDVWLVFSAITAVGCLLLLSNAGVSVAVERDLVTIIAKGSSKRLTRVNAHMRRIDLLSKLLAPLFVSALTALNHRDSAIILMSICGATLLFELVFTPIVFRRFPELIIAEKQASDRVEIRGRLAQDKRRPLKDTLRAFGARFVGDWSEFAVMPIFVTSISISLLYMSVLSFDSTFIAYLKSETDYSDAFIAGMRALCVATGLVGTALGPYLERSLGLVRAGTWSLWLELFPLTLCVAALFTYSPDHSAALGGAKPRPPAWNTALLFLGLALSRIGLWSFDLCQLAQVQHALSDHPRRNALQGLQFGLQNLFDLAHYGLTLGWNRPGDFRYAAAVSFGAVATATLVYLVFFARKVRGHVVHLDQLQRLLPRKTQ